MHSIHLLSKEDICLCSFYIVYLHFQFLCHRFYTKSWLTEAFENKQTMRKKDLWGVSNNMYIYVVVKYLRLYNIRSLIRLLPGTFCVIVAAETTDEHEHLGLEPINFELHQTQENREKKKKKKTEKAWLKEGNRRKGRDGSPNGSLATFWMWPQCPDRLK